MSFDPNEKQSVICERKLRRLESDSVKSARKDKLHKACQRASETCERTLHRQEQNRMCMASMGESQTFEQTVQRKERDRMLKTSMRESKIIKYHAHMCCFVAIKTSLLKNDIISYSINNMPTCAVLWPLKTSLLNNYLFHAHLCVLWPLKTSLIFTCSINTIPTCVTL